MSPLPPYAFHSLISWTSGFGVVLDVGASLLVPTSPPGFCSRRMLGNSSINVYASEPCIAGTSQNGNSSGPCILCPPGTMNNGSFNFECEKCVALNSKSEYCLRGALTKIAAINMASYDQANPYPESPASTEFDDVLLQNVFKLGKVSAHCLLQSPLMWTVIMIIIGLIFCFLICLLTYFSKCPAHGMFMKKVFIRLDLIGQGKFWMGGLVSILILVLIGFVIKFDHTFARLYPIESISNDNSCNPSLLNAKFTSTLQLLSIHRHTDEQLLFDMLDYEQNITLTIRFVSTGFTCHHLTMQHNMNEDQYVPSNNFACVFDRNNGILTVSTVLSRHLLTLQFNLTGPYFIGGLRICFLGLPIVKENGKYTAELLDACQFYYTANETLTINPFVNVEMMKTMNRTAALHNTGDVIFSGRWLPILTLHSLSDDILYRQGGENLRYLSQQTTLLIQMIESKFYIKNTQEPIARKYEITFNTLLFTTLCIELVGLLFLVFKLSIAPFVRLIQKRIDNRHYNTETTVHLTHIARAYTLDNKAHTSKCDASTQSIERRDLN